MKNYDGRRDRVLNVNSRCTYTEVETIAFAKQSAGKRKEFRKLCYDETMLVRTKVAPSRGVEPRSPAFR